MYVSFNSVLFLPLSFHTPQHPENYLSLAISFCPSLPSKISLLPPFHSLSCFLPFQPFSIHIPVSLTNNQVNRHDPLVTTQRYLLYYCREQQWQWQQKADRRSRSRKHKQGSSISRKGVERKHFKRIEKNNLPGCTLRHCRQSALVPFTPIFPHSGVSFRRKFDFENLRFSFAKERPL